MLFSFRVNFSVGKSLIAIGRGSLGDRPHVVMPGSAKGYRGLILKGGAGSEQDKVRFIITWHLLHFGAPLVYKLHFLVRY